MQQEIQRLQRVVAKVRFILTQLQQAIKGEVVMTEELQETLYAVYDAKVGRLYKHHSGCYNFQRNTYCVHQRVVDVSVWRTNKVVWRLLLPSTPSLFVLQIVFLCRAMVEPEKHMLIFDNLATKPLRDGEQSVPSSIGT